MATSAEQKGESWHRLGRRGKNKIWSDVVDIGRSGWCIDLPCHRHILQSSMLLDNLSPPLSIFLFPNYHLEHL